MKRFKYEVNIETPESMEEFGVVQEFLQELGPGIGINGAFNTLKGDLESGRVWLRRGYAFKFWFNDLVVAEKFAALYSYAKVEPSTL